MPAALTNSPKRQPIGIRPKGLKLWLFRITSMIVAPLAFLLCVELVLRIVGYGHPTSFLMESKTSGKRMLVQNNRFGWRFFGPKYSRVPVPFSISRTAPPDTIRIFVMGESAAFGDPQPEFGLPRMLDAMLSLRYPATDFEVINVAMTAINSHVIREIAKDCATADGDLWVLYIGNNEVVGPFGGGTVFGPQVPPLTSIRANLWLKTTRTGQLFDAVHDKLKPNQSREEAWGGMMMFLDHQVPLDDPRMNQVYDHFQINLEDIIACGRKAGAGIAVCTVAVNLRDCAPFASKLQSSTDEQAAALWQSYYEHGAKLQEQGQWASAIESYQAAEMIDDHFAELHFRKGQCALEMNGIETASLEFGQARDLDTLRFRFDSHMSSIVRAIVSQRKDPQLRFVDTEAAFAEESPYGIPGRELFYDHVHLTWEGNWLLAVSIAKQLDELLPLSVKNSSDALPSWPSSEQCAKRLAWTARERFNCLNNMRGRLADPPFTSQLNHAEQVTYLRDSIKSLEPAGGPVGLRQTLVACEAALTIAPYDSVLLDRLAVLRLQAGNRDGAIKAARKVAELLPHDSSAWDRLASIYLNSNLLDEAFEAFNHALRLNKDDVWTRHHLAQAYVRAGRPDEAMEQWHQAIALQPKAGTIYLHMGRVLESQGKTGEAEAMYRKAIANPVNLGPDLALLGKLCLKKGWYEEALKNLRNAALQSPTDAAIRYDLAAVLKAMGRNREAAEQTTLAQQYDSNLWATRFQKGLEYGRQGSPQKAVIEFREVVRLQPDLMEGHLNLAVALSELGRTNDAVVEFKQVLRLDPNNAKAMQSLEKMGAAASPVDSR